ncbi:MAG: cation-transporting P-type ATPase, partial [Promethearchaeota archaeon]
MLEEELAAHCLTIEEVSKALNVSIERGLSEEEAKKRLEKYGLNELIETKKISALQIFLNQFKDFLVYLLLFAIAISLIIGYYEMTRGEEASEFLDALVIFIILVVNAILG